MSRLESERNIADFEREPLADHCGIVAAYGSKDTSFFLDGIAGLLKLQTRGQDGAGVCAYSESSVQTHKDQGVITDVFDAEAIDRFINVKAPMWLFQTRYGTNGSGSRTNIQPIIREHLDSQEKFVLIHNGQFSDTNGHVARDESDTVLFADLLANSTEDTWDTRILNMQETSHGAWSAAIATPEGLYLLRDDLGVRPLAYGAKKDQQGNLIWVAASEVAGLESIGINDYEEVLPGSVIKIDENGPVLLREVNPDINVHAACVFENIYLENGNSPIHRFRSKKEELYSEPSVTNFRMRCGKQLAYEETLLKPENVHFAIGIPGTGIAGGRAYALTLGIPYIQAITDRKPQEHDARTFMTPDISQIPDKIKKHFYFEKNFLEGRSVVLIDDSMVRGNITAGITKILREEYGVTEVHIRVLCPPIDKPCYLGINTRDKEELIAFRHNGSIDEINQEIGADSLAFLSDNGLLAATERKNGFCMGCMVNHLPPIDREGNVIKKESNVVLT